jgi:hypothetical protein
MKGKGLELLIGQLIYYGDNEVMIKLKPLWACRDSNGVHPKYKSIFQEINQLISWKNAVFWDVMLCGSCKNECFGGT